MASRPSFIEATCARTSAMEHERRHADACHQVREPGSTAESDMASLIENYGFIGDLHGSALVSRDGSMDWLCLPRFDSDACMAALLGRDEHGHWSHHPGAAVRRTSR